MRCWDSSQSSRCAWRKSSSAATSPATTIWKPLARSAFPNAAYAATGRWRAPGCTASYRAETAGGSRHRYLFPELLDFGEHGDGLGDFRTRRIVITPERIERALCVAVCI